MEKAEIITQPQASYWDTIRPLRIICVATTLIFMAAVLNISIRRSKMTFPITNQTHPYLDLKIFQPRPHAALPQRQFDVVLSYYKEDVNYVARYIRYLKNVSTLQTRDPRIIVYNKNAQVNNTYLKDVLKADIVQSLPNLGREGATFLNHIIENYDTIANHTIFSQAGVEGITDTRLADWFFDRLARQFNSTTGYMPLVVNDMISKYDCGSHPSGIFPRLVELWGMLEQSLCPLEGQAVAFRGQFLASGKRIRARPLRVYKYINELITADKNHWLHRDPRSPSWGSSPDNPIFGHVVERLWTVLFNCSKPDLLDRCRQNKCSCSD